MDKIKVGVVGIGGISEYHLKGYIADKRCEVYALCDISEDRVREYSEKYGVEKIFTDYN